MTIEEIIEEKQIKLRETVIHSNNPEETIQVLENMGLDRDSATKLLLAYRDCESAKETSRSFWENATTYIAEIHEDDGDTVRNQESKTREHFDRFVRVCALSIITNTTEPTQISEDVFDKLFELSVEESEVTNPVARKMFQYYIKWKKTEEQRKDGLEAIKQAASGYVEDKEKEIEAYKKRIESLEKDNTAQREKINKLQMYIRNLPNRLNTIMKYDEAKYQAALQRINILQQEVEKLRDRGIFQTISVKLRGKSKDKAQALPESTVEIPKTLSGNWDRLIRQLGIETNVEELNANNTKIKGDTQDYKRDTDGSQK